MARFLRGWPYAHSGAWPSFSVWQGARGRLARHDYTIDFHQFADPRRGSPLQAPLLGRLPCGSRRPFFGEAGLTTPRCESR
jgi:hypothetical protein